MPAGSGASPASGLAHCSRCGDRRGGSPSNAEGAEDRGWSLEWSPVPPPAGGRALGLEVQPLAVLRVVSRVGWEDQGKQGVISRPCQGATEGPPSSTCRDRGRALQPHVLTTELVSGFPLDQAEGAEPGDSK